VNTKIARAGLVVLIGIVSVSCSRSHFPERDYPERYPVTGSVSYNGEAPVGCYVTLHPLPLHKNDTNTVIPRGKVLEDGKFEVTSYESKDGAPPGEYAITLAWTGSADPHARPGMDRWRGRYNNPRKPVQTLTITTAAVQLDPFELEGPTVKVDGDQPIASKQRGRDVPPGR